MLWLSLQGEMHLVGPVEESKGKFRLEVYNSLTLDEDVSGFANAAVSSSDTILFAWWPVYLVLGLWSVPNQSMPNFSEGCYDSVP